jgi:CRP-like cAMP-binding protein
LLDEKPELRGVRDRVLLLRAMPDLYSLDEDALVLMAEDAKVRRFAAGERMLAAGRPVDRVFVLVEGAARVERKGTALAEVREGAVGMLSLLAGDPDGVDAFALERTTALELPAESVHRNMQESFAITRNSVRQLARELLDRRGQLPLAPGASHEVDVGTWRTRPLTLVEKLLLLRATPLGQIANLDAAAELARAMSEVRVEPGEVLWSVGEPSTFWIRIEYGRVRCAEPSGGEVEVGAGFVLGVLDGWGDRPRSYEARAETPLILQRMDLAAQLAVLETQTSMAAQMTKFLARSVLQSEARNGAEGG